MLVTFSTGSPREEEANQGLPVEEIVRLFDRQAAPTGAGRR